MRPLRARLCLLALLALLSACGSDPEPARAVGEAYVAPERLSVRKALGPQEPVVATLRHGERVEILRRRRRFALVRAASGAQGWTDGKLLFTREQMEELRRLAAHAAALPSQGQATVYEALNLHSHPNRQAPTIMQLHEGDVVDVVAHRLEPRVPFAPDAPPPSVTDGIPADDWALVRTASGQAGWVLFARLVMRIPDEVAQYAEGRRITSYFSLGKVRDGDAVKHNWLWTSISEGRQPYQFDSVRVFVWSRRRHRYETAYIERNLRGYYPVRVQWEPTSEDATFSLVVEEKDGHKYRRTYGFRGYRVRLIGKEPWVEPSPPARVVAADAPIETSGSTWQERLRDLSRKFRSALLP
ncbi:MAG: hypothetical protein NZM33_04165 [Bryobacteraceae bacterium]|nr:hypothetical protein [Bryobacteraceae bacterium]